MEPKDEIAALLREIRDSQRERISPNTSGSGKSVNSARAYRDAAEQNKTSAHVYNSLWSR